MSQVVLEIVRNTQQQRLKDVSHETEEVSILIQLYSLSALKVQFNACFIVKILILKQQSETPSPLIYRMHIVSGPENEFAHTYNHSM